MANPLVAGPVDTTSPLSGTGLLDDGAQLASAIRSGNWVEGGLAAFSTAVDTVAAASDPLGSLIAAGLGWLIDHFEPLKGWFDDLTGDPGEVAGFAQTWNNIAQSLTGSGNELTRILGDVEDQHGAAMDAYRSFQQDAAHHIHGAAEWAGAMGKGLAIASQIVQLVHDLLRDVLSQLVGSAISWASEEFFSFGLATPWVIEQVTTRVSSLVEKVSTKLTAMLRSVKELSRLLDELKLLLSKAHTLLDGVLHGGSRSTETIADDTAKTVTKPRPYLDPTTRPSFRKGVVNEVWERAKGPDGKVRDPNTGEVIDWTPGSSRKNVWDMGHLPEAKYSEMHQRYVNGELTPQEFRDWYNDPDNYRPETPAANRSHRYE